MYDAFQPPAPSQTTLDWLSSGSMHELAPRIGVVQWKQTETNCSALNSLRREIMLVDQSGACATPNILSRSLIMPCTSQHRGRRLQATCSERTAS